MVEKLRVVIIDDEPPNRAELGDLLSHYPDIEVVGEASNVAEGWEQVEAQAPDLVFLDIRMEGETSGLDLARKINRMKVPPRLIFVTAYPEHSLVSHDYHPVQFLTKPLEDAKLAEALDWVRKDLARPRSGPERTPQRIAISHNTEKLLYQNKQDPAARLTDRSHGTAYLLPEEIQYICTSREKPNKLEVHLVQGGALVNVPGSMEDFQGTLKPHGFLRIHKSYIVNVRHVLSLGTRHGDTDEYEVDLRGSKKSLPVGRSYLASLREALQSALSTCEQQAG
ncbi:MAG: Transcriptional regulatory protein YehT [Chromatiales bacterium USCg_Taylor]|nr:MAG: Transcriptional regulatory protein YehT [Chromatiales bacterium USCg_Taylor]